MYHTHLLLYSFVLFICVLDHRASGFERFHTVKNRPLLLVSFDGFRWDYLDRGLTPTFNQFATEGSKAIYTVNAFMTKTFPNHYTLVTGLYEESHGLVGNHIYDPKLNDTFFLGNHDPKWWSQNGQEPIWITNQRQGGGSSAIIDYPGMNVPFNGMFPHYEYAHYNESLPFHNRSDFAASLLANGSVNFVALYFSEPDKTGHLDGPYSEKMNETLIACDDELKYLITKLQEADVYDKVNIIVTSDHGMASVNSSKTIFATEYLNGTQYPYFTTENNPVLGIWPNNSADLEPLYQSMKRAPHITVYKKEDIPTEYHYKHNIRVPPIVAVADEGWMILGSRDIQPHYQGRKGSHGYSNSLSSMHPIFMVHGPAFRERFVSEPFNSVDVYPLMCHLLGLKGKPNNGTMKTVKLFLRERWEPPPHKHDHKRSHSEYFTIGIAFAVVIAMLAIVLLTGMCLRQRNYRENQKVYRTIDEGLDSEDEEIFQDRDAMLPSTNI